MKERSITFAAPLVRALLDGSKTQIRVPVTTEWSHGFVRSRSFGYISRPIRREVGAADFVTYSNAYSAQQEEPVWFYSSGNARWLRSDLVGPGDRLWVKETWAAMIDDRTLRVKGPAEAGDQIWYRATTEDQGAGFSWRSPATMPRRASRLTLEVSDVRVERLHDITEADANAHGIETIDGLYSDADLCRFAKEMVLPATDARVWFRWMWDSTASKGTEWATNPWVWALTVRRIGKAAP